MDDLTFTSSLVRSLAWPAAIAVSCFVLRGPLRSALAGGVQRLKIGPTGFEVEWRETAKLITQETAGSDSKADQPGTVEPSGPSFTGQMLQLLSESSPAAVMIACSQRVAAELREIVKNGALGLEAGLNLEQLAAVAETKGLISAETASAVRGVALLYRLSELDPWRLDESKAREYIALTEGVLYLLERIRAGQGSRPESATES